MTFDFNSGAGADPPSLPTRLDEAAPGARVRVVSVAGDDAIARRLSDLGLRPGTEIVVLRRAPLGDPTVFELCGYQLCLRRREAARVQVDAEPLAAEVSTVS